MRLRGGKNEKAPHHQARRSARMHRSRHLSGVGHGVRLLYRLGAPGGADDNLQDGGGMTELQRKFERWATLNKWSGYLHLGKDEDGNYGYAVTEIAYQAWIASQSDVIDMITRQDYVETT